MTDRYFVLFGALAAVVVVASVSLAGQAPRTAESPAAPTTSWTERTAWGDPDLQGLWRNMMSGPPLERRKEFAGREFLTDAEVAAREEGAAVREAEAFAGELQTIDSGQFDAYNSIWGASRERRRIARRTSAIIDPPNSRLPPWTPQQVNRWEARQAASRGRGTDSWVDRSPYERCINVVGAGVVPTMLPRVRLTDGTAVARTRNPVRRILQLPGYVAMVLGSDAEYRIIPVDGRPALSPKIRQWVGDRRGHWEGNTLVVETRNINDQQDGGRFVPSHKTSLYPGSGETLRVIERFTRVDADTLEYRYTVEDPEVYTRPYTVLRELTRERDSYTLLPTQCHENNDFMTQMLAGARADEPWAVGLAAERAGEHQQRLEELKAEWEALKESR